MSGVKEMLLDKDVKNLRHRMLQTAGISNLAKSAFMAMLKRRNDSAFMRHFFVGLWNNLGTRKAVISKTGDLTFAEFSANAVRLADSLYKLGVREGDYIAVLLHNERAWFEIMGACMLSGIRMPMLNTHLKEAELISCINNTQAKVIIHAEPFMDVIQRNRDNLTSIKTYICTKPPSDCKSTLALETLIKNGNPSLPPGGFGFAQMSFSGGSTGAPKFITQEATTGRNPRLKNLSDQEIKRLKLKFVKGVARLGLGSISGPLVSLIPGPLYHAGVQMAVLPIYFGGTVIPMYKFDAEEFLATIAKEKVTWTFVAPTMLERVLKLPDEVKAKYDLSSMQILLCAAAPCPDYVKRQINALFKDCGAKVNVFTEYYGSSEAVLISVLRAEDYEANDERYASVGKAVASDCRIYNVEESRWCRSNEEGNVLIRNPRVFRARYGNNNEMDSAFREVNGQYWYDDGCIGYLDRDGFLYLTSRSKDMIISGGVNIYPVEIENILKSNKDILDVAVVRVKDEDLGEVPGVIIQRAAGSAITADEVITYCKNSGLYGFKLPKYVQFIAELPRNSSGKIRKTDLETVFHSKDKNTYEASALQ